MNSNENMNTEAVLEDDLISRKRPRLNLLDQVESETVKAVHSDIGDSRIEHQAILDMSLSAEEQEEARRMQEIAMRAEARAAARHAQLNQRRAEDTAVGDSTRFSSDMKALESSTTTNQIQVDSTSSIIFKPESENSSINESGKSESHVVKATGTAPAKFLTKAEREQLALERLNAQRIETEKKSKEAEKAHKKFITGQAEDDRRREAKLALRKQEEDRLRREKEEKKESKELDHEINAIRDHYLGTVEKKRRVVRPSEKFQKIFQFEWEEQDDTGRNDVNPLYNNRIKINSLFGRGYMGGIDLKQQRENSQFLASLSTKRITDLTASGFMDREGNTGGPQSTSDLQQRALGMIQQQQRSASASGPIMGRQQDSFGLHWSDKV